MTETEIRAQCVAEIVDGFLSVLHRQRKGDPRFSTGTLAILSFAMLPVFEKAKLPKSSTEETK